MMEGVPRIERLPARDFFKDPGYHGPRKNAPRKVSASGDTRACDAQEANDAAGVDSKKSDLDSETLGIGRRWTRSRPVARNRLFGHRLIDHIDTTYAIKSFAR